MILISLDHGGLECIYREFKANISDWGNYCKISLRWLSLDHSDGNIGPANGLVLWASPQLPAQMLTQIYIAI